MIMVLDWIILGGVLFLFISIPTYCICYLRAQDYDDLPGQ